MIGKLFIIDLFLVVYRLKHINLLLDEILTHIKESIKWNFGLNDNVSMLEVQCVDQKDKSAQRVPSRHVQLRHSAQDQSIEVPADGLVVR